MAPLRRRTCLALLRNGEAFFFKDEAWRGKKIMALDGRSMMIISANKYVV